MIPSAALQPLTKSGTPSPIWRGLWIPEWNGTRLSCGKKAKLISSLGIQFFAIGIIEPYRSVYTWQQAVVHTIYGGLMRSKYPAAGVTFNCCPTL